MKTQPLTRAALAAAVLFAAGAQAAEMTVYLGPNFQGKSFTLRGNANLADIGFQDKVSSIIVRSGDWRICSGRDLQGRCTTLKPGEYPRLGERFNNDVESMESLERVAYDDRGARGAEIHTQPNFSGKAVTLHNDTPNLTPLGVQDQASSIRIHSGKWQFCSQPNYQGDCVVLSRGDYPTLAQKLNHRVESAREVDRQVASREDDYRPMRRWNDERRWDNDRDSDRNYDRSYSRR